MSVLDDLLGLSPLDPHRNDLIREWCDDIASRMLILEREQDRHAEQQAERWAQAEYRLQRAETGHNVLRSTVESGGPAVSGAIAAWVALVEERDELRRQRDELREALNLVIDMASVALAGDADRVGEEASAVARQRRVEHEDILWGAREHDVASGDE